MNDTVDAMLKHADKSRKQRQRKPISKHGNETYKEFPKIGCIQHDCADCKRTADKLATQSALLKEMADKIERLRNHIVLNDDEGLAMHSDLIQESDALLAKFKEQQ